MLAFSASGVNAGHAGPPVPPGRTCCSRRSCPVRNARDRAAPRARIRCRAPRRRAGRPVSTTRSSSEYSVCTAASGQNFVCAADCRRRHLGEAELPAPCQSERGPSRCRPRPPPARSGQPGAGRSKSIVSTRSRLQRSFNGTSDALGPAVAPHAGRHGLARGRPDVETTRSRTSSRLPPGPSGEPSASPTIATAAVDFRGVEEGDASIERRADERYHLLLVWRRVVKRRRPCSCSRGQGPTRPARRACGVPAPPHSTRALACRIRRTGRP